MKLLTLLACFVGTSLALLGQNTNSADTGITGAWNGSYGKLRFVFHISKDGGQYVSTMDILNQNLKGVNTNFTTFQHDSLIIDGTGMGFVYKGRYNRNSNIIEGKFTEGVNAIPLDLQRGAMEAVQKNNRPQEPVKPYPYYEEAIVFENKEDGIQLAGTLTLPDKNSTWPAVVLVTGSGPQNRDEEIFGHKPFLILADHLTRQGFAVLRFDDRGVNESTGSFINATTQDFAGDVAYAVNYLKSRKEIDKHHIGLLGHSEGGIIAPLVANRTKDIAFIVLLAATGIPGKETVAIQSSTLRNFAVPDEAAYDAYVRKAIDIAAADKEVSLVRKELKEYYRNSGILKNLLPVGVDRNAFINNLVNTRTTPWVRFFYNYNPADELEKLTCPVLSLNGDKDMQVPASINQPAIKKALEKGGNANFVVKVFPGMNHFFQECVTGMPGEYARIQQTISPVVLQEISDWLKQQVKK